MHVMRCNDSQKSKAVYRMDNKIELDTFVPLQRLFGSMKGAFAWFRFDRMWCYWCGSDFCCIKFLLLCSLLQQQQCRTHVKIMVLTSVKVCHNSCELGSCKPKHETSCRRPIPLCIAGRYALLLWACPKVRLKVHSYCARHRS